MNAKRFAVTAAAAVLLAAGGTVAASAALAAPSGHACQAPQPSPATRHVITDRASLDGWANRHGSYVGDILPETVACEGGGLTQQSFVNYLDKGNLHAPLPAGVVVWAFPYSKAKKG